MAYLAYGRHVTCHGRHFDGGRKNCLAKIKIFVYSFLNLYFAPHARDVTRLDGARDSKQVLAPPCSNLRSFGSILKKVLVTLLGLFGAPYWFVARGIVFPFPHHYAPTPCIHKLQSCINTAPLPKALSGACYASTTKHYNKTVVLWHAKTRGSDIVTEQERSLAISMRPRPSHARVAN